VAGSCEHSNEPLGPIRGEKLLNQMRVVYLDEPLSHGSEWVGQNGYTVPQNASYQ
jgi:hypothetical protein